MYYLVRAHAVWKSLAVGRNTDARRAKDAVASLATAVDDAATSPTQSRTCSQIDGRVVAVRDPSAAGARFEVRGVPMSRVPISF